MMLCNSGDSNSARKQMCTFLIFCILLVACAPRVSAQQCSPAPCYPWAGQPCTINGRLSLQFTVDLAKENYFTDGGVELHSAVYAFCPVVDQLQVFNLNGAPFFSSGYKSTDGTYHMTNSMSRRYISAIGFGNSTDRLYPNVNTSAGAVLLAQSGEIVCGSSSNVAVVTALMLQIGTYKGLFNYLETTQTQTILVPNPDYDPLRCNNPPTHENSGNSSSSSGSDSPEKDYCTPVFTVIETNTSLLPAKTGFVPTCQKNKYDEDECILGDLTSGNLCIGDIEGQKNCARCYSTIEELETARLQIWTSYFGTDSRRYTMTSGGTNPLLYPQFTSTPMFGDISSTLNNLWSFNLSSLNFP